MPNAVIAPFDFKAASPSLKTDRFTACSQRETDGSVALRARNRLGPIGDVGTRPARPIPPDQRPQA